jgi:hypothetical protein
MRAYEEYQEAAEECWGDPNYKNCMKTRGWLTGGYYEVVDN